MAAAPKGRPTPLDALIATGTMDKDEQSAYCRRHGIDPAQLDTWKRTAIAALGLASREPPVPR